MVRYISAVPLLLLAAVFTGCSTPGVLLTDSRPVPDVTAVNQDGEVVNVRAACGGPFALVFFYPEADTPG